MTLRTWSAVLVQWKNNNLQTFIIFPSNSSLSLSLSLSSWQAVTAHINSVTLTIPLTVTHGLVYVPDERSSVFSTAIFTHGLKKKQKLHQLKQSFYYSNQASVWFSRRGWFGTNKLVALPAGKEMKSDRLLHELLSSRTSHQAWLWRRSDEFWIGGWEIFAPAMRNSKKKEKKGGVKVFLWLDHLLLNSCWDGFPNLLLAKGCNGNNQTSINGCQSTTLIFTGFHEICGSLGPNT
jgi:hypothetical protein